MAEESTELVESPRLLELGILLRFGILYELGVLEDAPVDEITVDGALEVEIELYPEGKPLEDWTVYEGNTTTWINLVLIRLY